jgi:hypothetical protein
MLAGLEGVDAEAIAGFVIVLGCFFVIEDPARVHGSTRPVHNAPDFLLVTPKLADSAVLTI